MKMHILHLGVNGFPYGQAAVNKAMLICRGLAETNCKVYFINVKGSHSRKIDIVPNGEFQGIYYKYTSGTPHRYDNFIKRNVLKIVGRINEIRFIFLIWRTHGIQGAIIATKSLFQIIYYRLLSKIFKFPLILNYMEYPSGMEKRRRLNFIVNDYFFEKYAFHLVDGIISISNFLLEHIKEKAPQKSILKIPVLANFEEILKIQQRLEHRNDIKYFAFCGSVGYIETIRFILHAFDKVNSSDVHLFLIVNGKEGEIKHLHYEIQLMEKKNFIQVYQNLSYQKLIEMYCQSIGLLIPLRDTIRDKARFPHKIGEYTATARPIITTNIGEIPFYFKDKVNAIISDEYDVDKYAAELDWVIENSEKTAEIGKEGYIVGKKHFDYKLYKDEIKNYIISLNNLN